MTIQRQYSLPNCQLIIEGVGPEAKTPDALIRPTLSTVTHVECHFLGHEKPIMGGRDLLESLAHAISEYAQEFLSGVAHPEAHVAPRGKPRLVQLERVDTNLHRLTVQPIINNPGAADRKAIDSQTVYSQLDLTTVQLFDLVEAIDQLIADSQTLPDLGVTLHPLAKRYATAQEPATQRALPVALGTSGLAIAAAALFYLPIPQVRRPDPANAQTPTTQESPVALRSPAVPGATPTSSPTNSPANSSTNSSGDASARSATAANSSAETSPSAAASSDSEPGTKNTTTASIASSDTPEPSTSNAASNSSGTSTPVGKPPNSEETEAIFNSSPEITDPEKLNQVLGKFRTGLYQAWEKQPDSTFNQDLVYQVGVNEQGEVVGYRFADQEAIDLVNETPLRDMLRRRGALQNTSQEPIAQFRVVFKSNGIAEISPWHGWEDSEGSPSESSPSQSN